MIQVRLSKLVLKDPKLRGKLAAPLAIAQATAERIRQRVSVDGVSATPARAYPAQEVKRSTKSGKVKIRTYHVGSDYAAKLGLTSTQFATSAAFHAAAKSRAGAANVTGGMWAGLQVRNWGGTGAIIDFGGTSIGASTPKGEIRFRGTKADGTSKSGRMRTSGFAAGRTKGMSRADKKAWHAAQVAKFRGLSDVKITSIKEPSAIVRNQEKASVVFQTRKIGVLQPTERETQAQLAAYCASTGRAVFSMFRTAEDPTPVRMGYVKSQITNVGDAALFNAILRRITD